MSLNYSYLPIDFDLGYSAKYPMTENAWQALRHIAKAGYISRATWKEFFSNSKDRGVNSQIRTLVQKNIIRPFSNSALKEDYFILDKKGIHLMRYLGFKCTKPIPMAQISHDETLISTLLRLKKRGYLKNWRLESELKYRKIEDFRIEIDARYAKYPDAVIEIFDETRLKKTLRVAIEFERMGKSAKRYHYILWRYSRLAQIDLILFICQTPTIQRRIENQKRRLNSVSLRERVAFMTLKEWQHEPLVMLDKYKKLPAYITSLNEEAKKNIEKTA